ncbi:MAG: tetratricopeptide repeat protein [bacterium]|nr:tetratricopeptide repeat protein [bacterium]
MRTAAKRVRVWLLLFAAALVASTVLGQRSVLEEEERVTAVDIFIELDAEVPGKVSGRRALPRDLGLEDFEVRVDGELRPVVSFFDQRTRTGAAMDPLVDRTSEPWTIVLYFDLELAERDTVRWAAGELAERVQELVKLGEVELVIAEDGGVRSLAPTRDVQLLEDELAGMALDSDGVHEVIELRAEVLEALRGDPEDPGVAELGLASVEQEAFLIGRHLDELLVHLSQREVSGSKRVLFWVSDGFDLEPAEFYRSEGFEMASRGPALVDRTKQLAATLASYGWVTFGLSPPPSGPGLVPGFRIGKWLYRPRMPPFKGIGGTLIRESRRDPEKAEAYHEIGEAHLQSGDAESAREAFEKALYHFAGDPRTSKEQAAAKAGLGRAFEAQGEAAEAREAFRHAVELDPDLAQEYPQSRPRLLEPLALQETLALETAGRTVLDSDALSEAVLSLERRARLTYQLSGWPQGSIHSLEVRLRDSELALRHPSRTRSGTPRTVAAALARRLAAHDQLEGELSVQAGIDPKGLVVELDRESLAERETQDRSIKLRLTVARARLDGLAAVTHERLEIAPRSDDEVWVYRMPLDELADEEWVAVIVEDIETGRWGADLGDTIRNAE